MKYHTYESEEYKSRVNEVNKTRQDKEPH